MKKEGSAISRHTIATRVNGVEYTIEIDARRSLADMLRDELGLTGTHLGCEHGICGSCTVLIDDQPARACLVFGVQVDGHSVRTVESLANDYGFNDLQHAFSRRRALQCGYCSPGFLMLIEGYLATDPEPDEVEIREIVSSNLCRCTGYQSIIDAVVEVARARRRAARRHIEP